jgi:hypothetical protein
MMNLVKLRKAVQVLLACDVVSLFTTSFFMSRRHPWVKDVHQVLGYTLVGLAISHVLLSRPWFIFWVKSKSKPA